MEFLQCKLSNCYGIDALEYKFDFKDANTNVFAIYARNGLMKTSFAKTFKMLQEGKESEIRDEIFNEEGQIEIITEQGPLNKDSVFVIKSFENSYESNSISSLLVNEEIKANISELISLQDSFLKKLEKASGVKISRTLQGKIIYELEPKLIKDLELTKDGLLLNLKKIRDSLASLEIDREDILYVDIFDESVLKKISNQVFQDSIEEFCVSYEEIYRSFSFLDKGNFTLSKLKNINKALDSNHFFVKENKITLDGDYIVNNIDDLKVKIDEIEVELKKVDAYAKIEKLLNDSKGIVLRDIIENNPHIIPYLKSNRLDFFKKQLWISYIKKHIEIFQELENKYNLLEDKLGTINLEDTQWSKALRIFEERFTLPYKMSIQNYKSTIIGSSIPKIEFTFKKNGKSVNLDRSRLDNIDVLSQGEKRALYLLNIIFDIEKLKNTDREIVFIIDDIADSFDYKNKYAIVEYLYEIAQNNNFYLLILSHNFDFYRTISSRLSLRGLSRLHTNIEEDKIVLTQEKYQLKSPFVPWKNNPNLVNVLALIPFVRNIIEYTVKEYSKNNDYLFLTSLLHIKHETNKIIFNDLLDIYNRYLNIDTFESDIELEGKVCEALYKEADEVTTGDCDLEYKLLLAIAIRHKAERFMFNILENRTEPITWNIRRSEQTGLFDEFCNYLDNANNQTRELYYVVKQFVSKEIIEILDEVNIMTPENIHLNSFMYEPLLDMDIQELLNLYSKVKALNV
ncbi:putative cytoplasmic protein [Veillonella parvula DSM 2008]|uniref:hypothetical protein n=1 Tax=Veillonella parvula TaxID=29466 RepID=UPI00019BFBCD|nr:hypothetical protein [Veillonella parvula]ACZ25418.1 putative cytoplasmic protein [Veillonella parvula DSM 2008]QQB17125.1 hypothetical protein I6I03_00235 [Veillonella parvula]SNV02404.1 Uncharacterized protein conserved in bacteria [Veillonella parvula]